MLVYKSGATQQGYDASDGVRQKYAGMEADESGLSHTLWRQYDAKSGRWTAPDPYGGSMSVGDPQSFNRYSYVNNDPVNKVDPLGLMATASTSWGEVAGSFWPAGFDFNRTHFGGPGVIAYREGRFDRGEWGHEFDENYPISEGIPRPSKKDSDGDESAGQTDSQNPEQGTATYQGSTYAQVPPSGTGYYRSGRPNIEYGNMEVVSELIAFARQWHEKHPDFDIGIGEMSDDRGRTISPHKSHKLGLRVDIRPIRKDGKHLGTNWRSPDYNQALTIELARGLRALPHVKNILFNDPVTIALGLTKYWKGHHNHLHVNFTRW